MLRLLGVCVFAFGLGACGEGGGRRTPPGAIVDPAPGIDTPGEHGGAGCPDSAETTFSLSAGNASSSTLAGTVTGASGAGSWYVRGSMGEEVGGALETTIGGAYLKTVPLFCGTNLVKLRWSGASCPLVVVYQIERTTCASADLVVTMLWDAIGDDWEIHLIKPGGRINDNATDCTWTSCINTSPDWGVLGDAADNPHKDIDDVDAFGPENIWLAGPEAGTYTIMVEHWGPGDPASDGTIVLNVQGQTVTATKQDLRPQFVWKVATVTFPGATIATFDDTTDCSASWSGGCRLQLP